MLEKVSLKNIYIRSMKCSIMLKNKMFGRMDLLLISLVMSLLTWIIPSNLNPLKYIAMSIIRKYAEMAIKNSFTRTVYYIIISNYILTCQIILIVIFFAILLVANHIMVKIGIPHERKEEQ